MRLRIWKRSNVSYYSRYTLQILRVRWKNLSKMKNFKYYLGVFYFTSLLAAEGQTTRTLSHFYLQVDTCCWTEKDEYSQILVERGRCDALACCKAIPKCWQET